MFGNFYQTHILLLITYCGRLDNNGKLGTVKWGVSGYPALMIGAGAERNGKPFLVICKVVIYLWWITKPWFDKVEHSNESFSAIILVIKSEFRAVLCFALWIIVSVNIMGFSFFWVWLSPLVETWWRCDDDSGYSGKTRSIPFYIWIWTTYALWLSGSLIGYNAGFIQDYLVYLKPMGNLC